MTLPSALADEIASLVAGLRSDSWVQRTGELRKATALLADTDVGQESEEVLAPLLIAAAADQKWEVRKAAAQALAEAKHLDSHLADGTLDELAKDSNRWVSQAALRAGKRRRRRTAQAKDWPLTEDTQDPVLRHIAGRISEIGLRSLSPALVYDIATEVAEISYRDLAADTAHEIRTLLTPLQGYLVEIRRQLSHGPASDRKGERYVATALGRLQLLEALVADLHMYSSPGNSAVSRVGLDAVLVDALSIGSGTAAAIEEVIDVPQGLVIEVLRERLTRALANLVANARQAMPHGGTLHLGAKLIGANSVEVTVQDSGKGMTDEQVGHAMERFRTTRRDEGGTGLGLPIAHRIVVEDHGGDFSVESQPGTGTRVVVVLPLRRDKE